MPMKVAPVALLRRVEGTKEDSRSWLPLDSPKIFERPRRARPSTSDGIEFPVPRPLLLRLLLLLLLRKRR